MGLSDYLVPCLSAFAACLGFCIIFNIRAPGMVICSIGGGCPGWSICWWAR